MSGGDRLNREELRDEVKDYLVELREERIKRSVEVSERLRQLRRERIERQREVRSSMTVTRAIREKTGNHEHTEEAFSRDRLKARVKQMRAEVQEMLQRYKATRSLNLDDEAQVLEIPSESKPNTQIGGASVDNRDVARAVEYKQTEVADPKVPDHTGYQNRLNQVVTDLGKNEKIVKKNDLAGTPQDKAPEKGQSLMGRIRSLASGNYKERASEKKAVVDSTIVPQTHPVSTVMPEKVVSDVSEFASESRESKSITSEPTPIHKQSAQFGSVKEETVHTVIRRATDSKEELDTEECELLEINGIGPSVLKRLRRIGICSFQDLASTSVSKLESSFGEYAKLTDLGDWVREAKARLRNP